MSNPDPENPGPTTLNDSIKTIDHFETAAGGKKDGVLTQADLNKASKKLTNYVDLTDVSVLNRSFNAIDTNHDGKIGK